MPSQDPNKWLAQKRTVHFGDTDSAGVIHFHQIFRWAHEAWEESLKCYGLSLRDIFPTNVTSQKQPEIFLPVINCQANFYKPLAIDDQLIVKVNPQRINNSIFEIKTEFIHNNQKMASSLIRHIAINSYNHKKCDIPKYINLWIEASSTGKPPTPI